MIIKANFLKHLVKELETMKSEKLWKNFLAYIGVYIKGMHQIA